MGKVSSEQAIGDRSVLQIARRVAATVGLDFFQAIAKHVSKALDADCVLIGEFAGGPTERVRTLAACLDGESQSLDYDLPGSASALIATGKQCLCRSDAQSRFPTDTLLQRVGAQACIGVPLPDPRGQPRGLIMALYRQPVTSLRVAKEVLDIFSARACAELNRKREDDLLRKSEQRYRVFIARNPDAMWRIELEQPIDTMLPEQEQFDRIYKYGYVAECNDALANLLGRTSAEQVIGCRVGEIAPPEDENGREATLLAIRSKHRFTTVETSHMDRHGHRRHLVRSQWGIVEDGMLERIWGTTRDITDLKQSEQELDASEQRMVDLLETVRLVVVMTDLAGRVSFCNHYFYRLMGWKAEDVLGKDWLSLMVPVEEHDRLRAVFAGNLANPDVPVHFDSTVLGPEGRRWQFDWDRTDLCDAHGNIAAWANVGRDVTEHRALEAQFRQAQKLASVGRLAGGIAHDFNNLLTVIMGYSTALLEDRDPLDAAYSGLLEIRNAACQGAELTHRLLAFSRRQVTRPQAVNLNTIIVECCRLLPRLIGEDVRLTTRLDPNLGCVRADAGHLHQVLMNLAVNARDAMPGGGELTIATCNAQVLGASPLTQGVPHGEYVELNVADTGVGMNEEVQRHLFEPFFTTKDEGKGTGLGLSTVYGIVQQCGGRIVVETELGMGTRFRIFFPRVPPESAAPAAAAPEVGALRGSESILLVEDQEEVRKLTESILASLGYKVLVAESPQRALELAREMDSSIQLLLTDVVMPGTSGVELADLIHAQQSGVKVLFMSGYGEASRVSEKILQPGFGYLPKPFTPDQLAIKVRETLTAP